MDNNFLKVFLERKWNLLFKNGAEQCQYRNNIKNKWILMQAAVVKDKYEKWKIIIITVKKHWYKRERKTF